MEIAKVKAKKYNHFVGIDISKNKLDYAVMHGKQLLFHETGRNDPVEILAFIERLEAQPGFTIKKTLFCMEHIGLYGNYMMTCLKDVKANLVVESPLKIKSFMGLERGKDDKWDSIKIAIYAQKNKDDLNLWVPKRPVLLELMNLVSLRNQLLTMAVALKTSLKETSPYLTEELQNQRAALLKGSVDAICGDLLQVDLLIDKVVDLDDSLKRIMTLISSVKGVGRVTALYTIICTNEFRDINNPKKFACYAGVAPFKNESGITRKRARVSKFANKKMKALLHTCALAARNTDPELRNYFLRKTQEGKPKFSVLNAIRYKLILRIFACVKQDRLFIRNYRD